MKLFALCCAAAFCLISATRSRAQNTGRVECARNDGYVYLYSSISTLEVRATLQCGALVQVTSRFDNYFGVRTAKGEIGFVPLVSIIVLKDGSSTAFSAAASEPAARERIHYDAPQRGATTPARVEAPLFTLPKDTPIRVKLLKTVSSATAHVGDPVEFEVLEELAVEGVQVLAKGSKAIGMVAEADPKRRFGHGGKVSVTLTSIRLADGEALPVRCYEEASGSSNTSSDAVLPLASGKDVALLQDAEFTALVDGDFHPKREAFSTPTDAAAPQPAAAPLVPQPR
jgi:hypothetical protein